MAAPKYNLNAMKNGTRLVRLTVGELPRQLNSIKIEGRRYRRALEAEVELAQGEITVTTAHAIDTAAAATVHAGICRWLLRQKIGTMQASDILACSRELLRAKETRDRSVRTLKLDRKRDVLDALYSNDSDEPEPDYSPVKTTDMPSNAANGERRRKLPRRPRERLNATIGDDQNANPN